MKLFLLILVLATILTGLAFLLEIILTTILAISIYLAIFLGIITVCSSVALFFYIEYLILYYFD